MSIRLTPDREHFIQAKLQAGKYCSVKEILETATRLLDKYDRSEAEWVEEIWVKIDAAMSAADRIPPLAGAMLSILFWSDFIRHRHESLQYHCSC